MENSIITSANQIMQIATLVIFFGLIFTKISYKIKMPDVVLYILAGIILGPNLLNWVNIERYPIENQLILSFGAAYILYDGGREIDLKVVNKVKISLGLLAVIGVLISSIVVGFFAKSILNLPLIYALLLGSVLASTDPSVLVPLFKKINISDKLKQTIIAESALNDAAGAVITFTILGVILGGSFSITSSLIIFLRSVIGGLIVGSVIGYLAHLLTDNSHTGIFNRFAAELTLVAVTGAYLISEHFHFSGFMAVFVVGVICGNKKIFDFWIPEESFQNHLRFKEVLTVIMRMMIFVLLGTHLDFENLIANFFPVMAVVFVLIFIARPLSVLLCTLPDWEAKWNWRELVYLSWVRETGVIPAALAGMLLASKVPHAEIISSVTCATILVTLTFQASSSGLLAKLLRLEKVL